MALFDRAQDYSNDVFRNIRGIKESQHLFDDLSDDPLNWDAANTLDMHTHTALTHPGMIQRGFDYSVNEFIVYPFEHITHSRYSNGAHACWYGSETLKTSIYETRHHFFQEIMDAWDVFHTQKQVRIDRRVAQVHCQGLAFDLSDKIHDFPWLINPVDKTQCQKIGERVAHEGHALLRVPSARERGGVNMVVFNQERLTNPRDYCKLQYVFDLATRNIQVYRGEEELILERCVILGETRMTNQGAQHE